MRRKKKTILYTPFILSVLIALILVTILLIIVRQVTYISRASGPAPVVRGVEGDMWADIVIGKSDFHQASENSVVPYKVFNPGGVVVDTSVRPNRIYVYDGANSRIMGYASIGVCSNNSQQKCTTNSDCSSNVCNVTAKKDADIVLGQPSLYGFGACNIVDGTMELFPNRKPASASSLCSIPPSQNSPSQGGSFASMKIDSNGNLYVPDYHNNRVLKFISPFTTDTVADDVWGQTDFTGYKCNLTDVDYIIDSFANIPAPSNKSLCFGRNTKYQADSFMAGVDVDQEGNVWVADTLNNRVVRYPAAGDTKTANLVLGQAGFTTRSFGSGMNRMNSPAVVRVHPTTNDVYVADYNNNRILVFTPPFTNGMNATRTFGVNLRGPGGIEFDPDGEGVWVADHLNNMTELWNPQGTTVLKVLQKDTHQPNGMCGSTTNPKTCINPRPNGECWDNLCSHRGSIGIDSDKNLYISSTSFAQDVYRYPYPIPTPQLGKMYSADKRLMSPPAGTTNLTDAYALYYPQGVVVTDTQLIVADDKRIVFWNNPQGLTSGKPADGAVNSLTETQKQGYKRLTADEKGNLYTTHNANIEIYTLPLTSGKSPSKTIIKPNTSMPVLGGGNISWTSNRQFWDLAVTADGKYLWLTDVADDIHRVLRIRDPLTNPVIDVVLGQADLSSAHCNRNPSLNTYDSHANPTGAQANTLCKPGAVSIDRLGNVWISDYALQYHGNRRLLMFKKEQFENLTTALYGPNADLVSPQIRAWKPAFNSYNQMLVGIDGQISPPGFPQLYKDPLNSLKTTVTPDEKLIDFFSHGYASAFDSQDNFYITDANRGRLLIYKNPFKKFITPTLTPTSILPTDTPIASPTPTLKLVNRLVNADFASCKQFPWKTVQGEGTRRTTVRVEYNEETGDCSLIVSCSETECSPNQSVYLDVDATDMKGKTVKFGGDYTSTKDVVKLTQTLFALDKNGNVIRSASLPIILNPNKPVKTPTYHHTFTVPSATQTLRLQTYFQTVPESVVLDNLFIYE